MEKAIWRIIDNDNQSRNIAVRAEKRRDALGIGSYELRTCNVRAIRLAYMGKAWRKAKLEITS